jgi:hypothetical protein
MENIPPSLSVFSLTLFQRRRSLLNRNPHLVSVKATTDNIRTKLPNSISLAHPVMLVGCGHVPILTNPDAKRHQRSALIRLLVRSRPKHS